MTLPDRIESARKTIMGFLRGEFDYENSPWMWEEDVFIFAVQELDGRDPDWLLGQLSSREWPAHLRVEVLHWMIWHYAEGHAILSREAPQLGRQEELATDKRYLDDDGIWSPERQDAHDAIVSDLYSAAAEVPCQRQAIMAGGLGGADKSTVLDKYANVDQSKYLTINPDNIKEEMAKRGLIPRPDPRSPMEASDLVHEESSAVAKMLARRAMADGKNIIWDITMNSPDSALSRLDALDAKGYSTKGIFVDITIDEAVTRADTRHRRGQEDRRARIGFGGRYVPDEVIRAQADPVWGSVNRRIFEEVKPRFAGWAVYDNNGAAPRLVQASQDWNSEVAELISGYKAGDLTLDELAQRFRARRWPVIKRPPPSSYLEMAARAQEDPPPDVPNSFDDVISAYAEGILTRQEYDVLSQAVQAARAGQPDQA